MYILRLPLLSMHMSCGCRKICDNRKFECIEIETWKSVTDRTNGHSTSGRPSGRAAVTELSSPHLTDFPQKRHIAFFSNQSQDIIPAERYRPLPPKSRKQKNGWRYRVMLKIYPPPDIFHNYRKKNKNRPQNASRSVYTQKDILNIQQYFILHAR